MLIVLRNRIVHFNPLRSIGTYAKVKMVRRLYSCAGIGEVLRNSRGWKEGFLFMFYKVLAI